VSVLAHHVALALAVWALVAAGLRATGYLGVSGLARVVAAVVLAAALAVASALVLGLVALGGSSVALTAAAVATWLVSRLLPLPAGSAPVRSELVEWARSLGVVPAVALGGVAGAAAAWTAWLFLHPALGHDMVLYHLPEAVQWVHSGHPGAIDPIISSVPVGSYPLTHEVLLGWGLAIGRSFVWATLVTALAPLLVGAAGWLGLRALGVDRLVRSLAVLALVLTPAVIASQNGGASLDPAALAWLVSCGALACGARERPALLALALVAAALAIGTKTTTAPLALAVLAVAAWPVRRRLRAAGSAAGPAAARGPGLAPGPGPTPAPALAAALVLAAGVGGVWYLRNIVQHGWPLWPFSSAPWGDARPAIIANADVHFIERPGETIDRLGSYYLHHFGGPLLVLCGAAVAPLLARTRAALAAAAFALASVFIWMNAPFTGVFGASRAFDVGTGDATRYLLPGAAAAALAVALSSRRGGWLRAACAVLLGAAALVGLRQTFQLGFPSAPAMGTPLAGLLVGAAAAFALVRLGAARSRAAGARVPALRRGGAVAAGLAALLAAGALGALAAHGYVERHGETGTRESPLAGFFASQPAWHDGDRPVASTWSLVATLAGDRLQHPLELVDATEACARGAALAGWLVVDRAEARARDAGGCGLRPAYSDHDYEAFSPDEWRDAPRTQEVPAP
jgi:hypothetical protein